MIHARRLEDRRRVASIARIGARYMSGLLPLGNRAIVACRARTGNLCMIDFQNGLEGTGVVAGAAVRCR